MHSHRVGWNRIYTQRCMCTHVHSQLRCTHNVVQLITWHKGWLEPHTYTVYDHTFGDFPAKNTICTPCIYGSGQSYIHTVAHVICGTLKLWHTAMHPHCGSHTVEHSSAITLWFTHTVAHSSTPTLWFTHCGTQQYTHTVVHTHYSTQKIHPHCGSHTLWHTAVKPTLWFTHTVEHSKYTHTVAYSSTPTL